MAAWAVMELLAADGVPVAYLDIDQVGMLYPASAGDPQRHRFKAEALAALVVNYARVGVRVVVVSGVADPDTRRLTAANPTFDASLFLLAPGPGVLRRRLAARGWDVEAVEAGEAMDSALRQAAWWDEVVDTTGLSIEQTAVRLRRFLPARWRLSETVFSSGPAAGGVPVLSATAPILVLTGVRAVGCSTVGFGLALNRWTTGQVTGYLDTDQLSFLAGPDVSEDTRSELALAQTLTMHDLMTAWGATLIVCASHDTPRSLQATLTERLPQAPALVACLRADPATLLAHVQQRSAGGGARLAGDYLLGAGPDHQRTVVEAATAAQQQLDQQETGETGKTVVDVTGRTPTDVITELESHLTRYY